MINIEKSSLNYITIVNDLNTDNSKGSMDGSIKK